MVCQTVSWVVHYFSNSFLKLAGNEYCSKLEKEFRFQVIYTPNISLEFFLIFEFKVISKLFPEHIENPRYIKNPFNMPCKTSILRFQIHAKSQYIKNLTDIQNNVNLQNTVYTEFSVILPFKNQRHIQNPIKYL